MTLDARPGRPPSPRHTDEIFSILMGEQVEPRRDFITKNAKYATLDV